MTNNFSLGAQVGGPDAGDATRQDEQELRDAFNRWQGDYVDAIKEFAFILRVDGRVHKYTQEWNILGAQPAKRKKEWIEVEIGVPEKWWREDEGRNYRIYLVAAIEKGLHSIIELLQRNKHEIKEEALLSDWRNIKSSYLQNIRSRDAIDIALNPAKPHLM
ncbi:MAG TPA: hypothetical protein VGK22_16760 [Candidatus Angelobacter sp.]